MKQFLCYLYPANHMSTWQHSKYITSLPYTVGSNATVEFALRSPEAGVCLETVAVGTGET